MTRSNTTTHRNTLIDTIIANWLECPSRLIDDETLPTSDPTDWDMGLLAALADLAEMTNMDDGDDTKRARALQLLLSPCEARCVYANDLQDALDLKALRVEDVEGAIKMMGGRKKKKEEEEEVKKEMSVAAGKAVPLREESVEMVARVATPYPSSPACSHDSLFGSSPAPESVLEPTSPLLQPVRLTPGLWQPPAPLFASRSPQVQAGAPVRQRLVLSEERRQLLRARKIRDLRNQLEQYEHGFSRENFGFNRAETKRELWEMEDEVEDEEEQEEQELKRMRFD